MLPSPWPAGSRVSAARVHVALARAANVTAYLEQAGCFGSVCAGRRTAADHPGDPLYGVWARRLPGVGELDHVAPPVIGVRTADDQRSRDIT